MTSARRLVFPHVVVLGLMASAVATAESNGFVMSARRLTQRVKATEPLVIEDRGTKAHDERAHISGTRLLTLARSALPIGKAGGTANQASETMSLHAELLKDWQMEKDRLMQTADAMPEEKFAFKASPVQRTYRDLIIHTADVNVMLLKLLGTNAPVPAASKRVTKQEVLKSLADSFEYGLEAIKQLTDQSLLETVTGPRVLGVSTKARIVYRTLGHIEDQYGRMVVYLRLNGIMPPTSAGI